MNKKVSSDEAEIVAIQDLMRDLESRVRSLNAKAKAEASGASDDIRDFVSLVLNRLARLVRETTENATHSVGEQAAHVRDDAMSKLRSELEQRPLTILALAAGAGYLLGVICRRK
jgi:ElaB/YqjD/DUF883 family membrane-anchored ribosome-binding protein